MNKPMETPVPTVPQLFLRMHCVLKHLASRASHTPAADDALETLRALLNGLPLALNEYAVAARHLDNAEQYLTAGESGAARYELQLLEGVCAHYAGHGHCDGGHSLLSAGGGAQQALA